MDFKERLKELRKLKGLSQAALAERLKLSKSTIGAYETGDITPSVEALNLVADYFNVSISYLLGEEDGSTYYLNPDAAEIAQELCNRDDLRALLDASRKLSSEDLQFIIRMTEGLQK